MGGAMTQRILEPDDTVCACMGAPTVTRASFPVDMEECIYCGDAVRWDKVDDPFFGFGTCEHAENVA